MSLRNFSNRLRIAAKQNVKEQDYWLKTMSGELSKSVFPYDSRIGRTGESNIDKGLVKVKFSRNINLSLVTLSNNSDEALHIILLAGLVLLLETYTGSKDIIVGIPIYYDENIEGELINTVLPIRTEIEDDKTFGELLLQIKETVIEADENLNYPIEELANLLNLPNLEDHFPLFDVALLLENIHKKSYLGHINHNITFSFLRTGEYVEGDVEYNALLYKETTIERIIKHFIQLLEEVLFNVELMLSKVDILSEDEKRQLLFDFNDTAAGYPKAKTIHELFENQVGRTPDGVAVVGQSAVHSATSRAQGVDKRYALCAVRCALSYHELNEKSNQLAHLLRLKGIKPDTIVGIMVERSLEMIIAIMAVLKAGGAYMPLDPVYPVDRIEYVLKDSGTSFLLAQSNLVSSIEFKWEIIDPANPDIYTENAANLDKIITLNNLAYVIYTSGSTGRPKGVMVEHHNLMAYINAFYREFEVTSNDIVLQQASFAFDAYAEEIYPVLLKGGKVAIPTTDVILDFDLLLEFIAANKVTIISCSPLLLNELNGAGQVNTVHTFISGGDILKGENIDKLFRFSDVYNTYGPTETTVCVTYYKCLNSSQSFIPIGKPISNYKVYILSRDNKLLPVGVPGELCVCGEGVTRGYLNNPELAAQKFIENPLLLEGPESVHSISPMARRMYRSGDLARWLDDGNIEFLDRVDHQVKIRGYRIELGEIENQLLKHDEVKEVVVLAKEDETGDKYICAYFVPYPSGASNSADFITGSQLRGYLAKKLPDYMIPSYFMRIDRISLTPGGKVDRKALPEPVAAPASKYVAPRDGVEKRMGKIWAEVMGISSSIGIDDNFFELGGHSLRALTLLSKIHKAFNVKIPLAELFRTPSIRGLSGYLKEAAIDKYLMIVPVENKEYYTLSSAQKRLYILQQMELKGIAYNMPEFIPLPEVPDIEKLEETFMKLINRHESLRTSFHMVEDEPVQKVHETVEFEIEYYSATEDPENTEERRQETKDIVQGQKLPTAPLSAGGATPYQLPTISDFIRPFDLSVAPLLRVGLINAGLGHPDLSGEVPCILTVDMHHIVSDGVSHEILVQDFMALYEGEALPPLRIQYKDFSQWQNSEREKENLKRQETYWLQEFAGEIPVLDIPTDYTRPSIQSFEGNTVAFEISADYSRALKTMALEIKATLYMVLLAIFNVLLSKLSSQEDIIIGTPVAGRRHADLEKIIGMFVNTLALRNYPKGEKTFREFLLHVKGRTLEFFENQEYQFEDLVEKVKVNRDAGRNPLFDVMFILANMGETPTPVNPADTDGGQWGDYSKFEMFSEAESAKFDLILTASEVEEKLAFTFNYCTRLFKAGTIERFIGYFKQIVSFIVKRAGVKLKLSEIEIIPEEERERLLFDFNNTEADYPKDKTLHELFEEQAERTPDRLAVVGQGAGSRGQGIDEPNALCAGRCVITYRKLNERAHQLARVLRHKGVTPNRLVGIMVRRSIDMIIGILGILKSGGAYLPVDPTYPLERKRYMLTDSGARLVLCGGGEGGLDVEGCDVIHIDDSDLFKYSKDFDIEDLPQSKTAGASPGDLIYTIYTSGSTGRPKGAGVYQRGFSNLVNWYIVEFSLDSSDSTLLLTSLSFDLTQKNIFAPLCVGGTLHILSTAYFDPDVVLGEIWKGCLTWINCTPGMFYRLIDREDEFGKLSSLRYVFLGGEPILLPILSQWLESRYCHAELVNLYGPTECTAVCSFYRLPAGGGCGPLSDSVPIGKPVYNARLYILDSYFHPVPIGVAGELCIGGEGIGLGYLNYGEMTWAKFQKVSFAVGADEYIYRTGDLAKWLVDENIEFIGRMDQQVKIRGFRIELEEIESQVLRKEEIAEAVVIPWGEEGVGKYLCAYIVCVPSVSAGSLEPSELKRYLSGLLPDYMIPSYFVELDEIPLNPNGKVDRRALPSPAGGGDEDKYTAPRTIIEEQLAKIWWEVLRGRVAGSSMEFAHKVPPPVGIDDDFFSLGGHSLNAVIMLSKVHKALNVKIPLVEVFKTSTIRGLAEYIRGAVENRYAAIEPVEEKEYYVLSSAQKRMYILQQMELESTAYNMPEFIPLETPETERLENCFKKLIQRHESLRTSFHMVNEEPVQKIHNEVEFEIEKLRAATSFIRPFDLSKAPLLRIGHLKSDNQEHWLLVDMHHIISDGVSHEILIKDFSALYENRELSPLRIQYKDFSQWQNKEGQKQELIQQEIYWLKQFEGEIPVLNLPADYPRPAVQSFEGDDLSFELEKDKTVKLNELALREGVTLYMVLVSVLNVLLSKLSSQEDIVIGTPIAGRRHTDLEQVIGMFVNTLALRNYPVGENTFREFLGVVKTRTLSAFENQDYQFEDLVEKAAVNRDAGRNPLFDVMLVLQSFADSQEENRVSGALGENLELQPQAKFDLTLSAVELDNRLVFGFNYSTSLYQQQSIKKFIAYFKKIISEVTDNPDIKLWAIEIISGEEKARILYDFNNTEAVYPRDKSLHELFEEQAERAGDKIAVIGIAHSAKRIANGGSGDNPEELPALCSMRGALSYLELNEKSNQLARYLKKRGVSPGAVVPIMVERSVEMIIGIFGILKAGGAYLPIEPGYPEKRLTYILTDSAAQLLLTRKAYMDRPRAAYEPVDLGDAGLYRGEKNNLEHINTSHDPVYTMYTSGSTGNPKGVIIEHGSVVNILFSLFHRYPFFEKDTYLFKTSYVFDVSVSEIFGWFWDGGRLAILEPGSEKDPERILEAIEEMGISHINFVPSMFNVFVDFLNRQNIGRLSGLRYIFLAGEALSPVIVNKFRELDSKILLENIYGPTEATIYASGYPLSEWNGVDSVSIGKPLQNMRLYIFSQYNNLLPVGVVGELCIAGAGLSRGYLNKPELTVDKFDQDFQDYQDEEEKQKAIDKNPLTSLPLYPSTPLYRTGDLARWLPDGNIEFLGRIDHQVKIRGFRIELGEIENVLLAHDKTKKAVITARGDAPGRVLTSSGDKYLCAYIVTVGSFDNTSAELKEYLSRSLPDYMIPTYFTEIENIPLTPSGKIDRKALPSPMVNGKGEYMAPRNIIEKKLGEIWFDVLGSPATPRGKLLIGIDDNFFGLGGHSLKATVMVSKIHKELNVRIPLAEVFKAPTIRGLSNYIKGTAEDRYASIEPVEGKEYYALSSAQKRLYILQQMELESTAYNMPEFFPLETPNTERLENSFKKLIQRHESLRTSFHMVNEEPVQIIHNEVKFEIERLTDATSFIQPFDLSKAPLLRIGHLKLDNQEHWLLVDMHHIISDGISHEILIKDFNALYENRDLPPLRIQYKDFSQWQNKEGQKQELIQQETYWLKQFEGEIPVLNLPADYSRPAVQSFEGDDLTFDLEKDKTAKLNELALREGVTLYMVLVSVFNVLLSKLSGQEDIVIGTPIAGRRHTDLEQIIGMFVNTLALRNQPGGEKTFQEFISQVKTNTLEAFENQEYQFEDLVEKAEVNRDAGRNPLFDVMFVLQNIGEAPTPVNRTTVNQSDEYGEDKYFSQSRAARFDLTLTAVEMADTIFFTFNYCARLFKSETIHRFINYFNNITALVVQDPCMMISGIDIISEQEKEQLLFDFNNTEADYPRDKTIHELFEKQVSETPDSVAVVGHSQLVVGKVQCKALSVGAGLRSRPDRVIQHLTYKELNRKANQLAHLLIEKSVHPHTIVGIMMERSIEMVVGILAILKAGGAYMPIDPDYPEERIKYILTDSSTRILLTTRNLCKGTVYEKEMIYLEDNKELAASLAEQPATNYRNSQLATSSKKIAYVIYTSGSTGKPKGVMIEHRSLVNYICWAARNYVKDEEIHFPLFTSISFDLTVTSIFTPLVTGNKLVVYGNQDIWDLIQGMIDDNYVGVVKLTPSHLQLIRDKKIPAGGSCIRRLILGGESLGTPITQDIYRNFSKNIEIYNEYGPTEATVGCMLHRFNEQTDTTSFISIGKPAGNCQIYLLDKQRNPVPQGVAGEIYIGGTGVARGYLNRPELTAEKFTSLPLYPSTYLYCTGDLARCLPDGNIEFRGRLDNQVKIRGFRVELGEIESRLMTRSDIRDVVVLTGVDESGDKYLCSYIVGEKELPASELREYLRRDLPDYMIPSYFVFLERLPLTPNGKVDRKSLPAPELKAAEEYIEPGDPTEEKLAAIWSEVLGVEKNIIGTNMNFFVLGGHSLKATAVVSEVKKQFDIIVPLVELFKTPTIRSLAEYIKHEREKEATVVKDENVILLKGIGNKGNHLFLVHDGSGEVEGYIEFCHHLVAEFNCWGIRANSFENYAPRNLTIEDTAKTYIETIKKVQPGGPYKIAGWSLGGTIAFEMLNQLEQIGEEVAFAALIDSPSPQDCTAENVSLFSPESERDFIKKYVQDEEIENKLQHMTDTREIWAFIVQYLEAKHFDVEVIKKVIVEYEAHVVPKYHESGIGQLVKYLNTGRSLYNARSQYTPTRKIHTPVHYFAAAQSKEIKREHWNAYCEKPLKCFEIEGDHYSIFKVPHAANFAKIFSRVINEINEVNKDCQRPECESRYSLEL